MSLFEGLRRSARHARSSTFAKLLLSFMLINLLNVLFAFGFYYWRAERVMKDEIDALSRKLLAQTQNISNYLYTSTVKGGYGLYYDDSIFPAMFSGDELDVYDQNKLTTRMNRFIQMNPIVHSIYLYNIQLDTVISSRYPNSDLERFPDREMTDIVKNFSYSSPRIPYLLRDAMPGLPQGVPALSLIVTEPSSVSGHVLGAMIINLDGGQLRSLVSEMADDPWNRLVILQQDGRFVTAADEASFSDETSRFRYRDRIEASGEAASGSFIEKVGGEQYVFTWQRTNLESTGFVFVSIYPYTTMFKSLIDIRNLTLIGGTCLIAASFAASVLLSRKIYFPIRSLTLLAVKQLKGMGHAAPDGDIGTVSRVLEVMVEKNETLESFSRRTRKLLRDQLLRSLLLGHDATRSARQVPVKDHDLPFGESDRIQVVLLRIDRYRQFEATYDGEHRYLLRYAMANIAEETLSERCRAVCVDIGEDHIAAILGLAAGGGANLAKALETVQLHIRQYLKLSVTIGIGEPAASLAEAAFSYEGALSATHYRIFRGPGAAIAFGDLPALHAEEYPHDKEKAVLDELRLCRPRKVAEAIDGLLAHLQDCLYKDVYAIIAQSAANIMKSARALPNQGRPPAPLRYDEAYARLAGMESAAEIRDWLLGLFSGALSDKAEAKRSKNAATVDKGLKMIEEHYRRVDFSVSDVSERLQYSVSHLNKLFTEATGFTVHELINRSRLNKAEELVRGSDMLVHDIAEAAGFSSGNYFYYVFKKEFGTTPIAYRKLQSESAPGPAEGSESRAERIP